MYRSARARNIENYNRGLREGFERIEKRVNEFDTATQDKIRAIIKDANEGVIHPVETNESTTDHSTNIPLPPVSAADFWSDTPAPQVAQIVQPKIQMQTPDEIRAEKERRTLTNLNMLLYVGSFLIVAAMAVFVTLTMSATVKLASLVAVTAAFYATGLALHARSMRLRPAALAFVGTGLAILPFFGLALTSLGGVSVSVAWFITSAFGLVAYGFAAVRLQSQLVSYLTIAFVLSFSLSCVSTLGLGMIWYFIVLIGVSLVLNSIHYLAPKHIPSFFAQPIERTAHVATPVTLLASLTQIGAADLYMYEVLFGLATIHYMVAWLEARLPVYEILTRVLAHTTGLLIIYDVAQRMEGQESVLFFNIAWLCLALMQATYSFLRVRIDSPQSLQRESVGLGVVFALMIVQLPAWLAVEDSGWWLAFALAVIGLLSVMVSRRLHQSGWLYLMLSVSIALPFVIGRQIILPPLDSGAFAVIFTILGTLALAGLDHVKRLVGKDMQMVTLMTVASVAYVTLVIICGLVTTDTVMVAWSALAAGVLTLVLSYILGAVKLEAVAAALTVWSISTWVVWLSISPDWNVTIAVLASSIVLLLGALVHQQLQQHKRRRVLVIISALVFAGLVFSGGSENIVIVRTAVALLLAAAIVAVALRELLRKRQMVVMSNVALGMYVAYPALALCLVPSLGNGWTAATLLVYAGIVGMGSYIEEKPRILLLANFLFVIGLAPLWHALKLDTNWMMFGVTWMAAAVYYSIYWHSYRRKDEVRMLDSLVSALIVLFIAAYYYAANFVGHQWVIASATSLIAAAAILGAHGVLKKKHGLVEIALYVATLGLQRIISVLLPDLNLVFYAHWWAAAIMLVAMLRREYHTRLIAALGFVTASTGSYALTNDQSYSVLFLVEHLIVAITGAVVGKQWIMWWGIVAVIVAVLYFLRNFTVLILLFLGAVLITFVIWRLLKVGKNR